MKQTSIVRGALLLTGGSLFLRLCSMVFQVYLSREVGAAGLGLLQLISSVGVLAMALGCSGVRVAAMYLPAEEYGLRRSYGIRRAVNCCLVYGLCVSTAAAILLYACSDWLALHWLGDLRAAPSLKIMAAFLPFTCLCAVMSGYFTACAKIRQLVGIEIAERLVSLLATIVLLRTWARGSIVRACCAIIGGSSIGSVFDFAMMYAIYHKEQRQYPAVEQPLHMPSRLLKLCVPLALNDYLRSGLSTAEQFLIPYGLSRAGQSYEAAMSAYGTIHGMVFPLLMFPAVILYSVSDLLVPELSRCRAANNRLRIHALTKRCIQMGTVFAALVAGVCYTCAMPLGQVVYHSETAGHYLMLFAPMVLMLYLDAIVDGTLKGLAQQLYTVRYNTITSLLDVLLLVLLLPKLGIAGYYFSFALTHLLNFCLSIGRLCKVTDYKIPLSYWLRVGGCVTAAVLVCRLLPAPEGSLWLLLGQSGCFFAVSLGLLLLTDTLHMEDLRWLRWGLTATEK